MWDLCNFASFLLLQRQKSVDKLSGVGGVPDTEPLSEHEELDDIDPGDDECDSVTTDVSQVKRTLASTSKYIYT